MLAETQLCLQHACGAAFHQLLWAEIQRILHLLVAIASFGPLGSSAT